MNEFYLLIENIKIEKKIRNLIMSKLNHFLYKLKKQL